MNSDGIQAGLSLVRELDHLMDRLPEGLDLSFFSQVAQSDFMKRKARERDVISTEKVMCGQNRGSPVGVFEDVRQNERHIHFNRRINDCSVFGHLSGPVELFASGQFRILDQSQSFGLAGWKRDGNRAFSPGVLFEAGRSGGVGGAGGGFTGQDRVEAAELNGRQKYPVLGHAFGNFKRPLKSGSLELLL